MKKSIIIIFLALINIGLAIDVFIWQQQARQWRKASDGWQDNAMKCEKVANDLILTVKDAQKVAADAVAASERMSKQMIEIMMQVDNYRSIQKSP